MSLTVPEFALGPGGHQPLRGSDPQPRPSVAQSDRGEIMGKEARIALLLSGTACLLAVMVDWVVAELQ